MSISNFPWPARVTQAVTAFQPHSSSEEIAPRATDDTPLEDVLVDEDILIARLQEIDITHVGQILPYIEGLNQPFDPSGQPSRLVELLSTRIGISSLPLAESLSKIQLFRKRHLKEAGSPETRLHKRLRPVLIPSPKERSSRGPVSSGQSLSIHAEKAKRLVRVVHTTANTAQRFRPIPPPPPPSQPVTNPASSALVEHAQGKDSGSEAGREDRSLPESSATSGTGELQSGPSQLFLPSYFPSKSRNSSNFNLQLVTTLRQAIVCGVECIDALFAPRKQLDESDASSNSAQAVELMGPTASGKSSLSLRMLLRMRLQAVLSRNLDDVASGVHADNGQVCIDHNQCLIIDTEGSMTSSVVAATLHKMLPKLYLPNATHSKNAQLCLEVLSGVHIITPRSVGELIALLRHLSNGNEAAASSSVPPVSRLSVILLDSASYLLRAPVDQAQERQYRRLGLSMLSDLQSRLQLQNPALTLIATNQMGLKMFAEDGELVNYRTTGSIARLVPQLDRNATDSTYVDNSWSGSLDSQVHQKGSGCLGPGAHRMLLFRASSRRFAHIIYRPCGDDVAHTDQETPPVPFDMEPTFRSDSSMV